MFQAARDYFETLADRFGQGWNRFWFTPIDSHLLGLIRILTGAVALYWWLSYLPDLQRFFGPEGILPGQMVQTWRAFGFSYFDLLQSSSSLWVGYYAGLVVLVLFTLGLWTRVTSVLAWLVVMSLIQRGPMLANQLEDILAFMLLYQCIGPRLPALSLDRWLARRRGLEAAENTLSVAASISIRLMQIHVSVVYFMMAIAKFKMTAWWGGTAVWWIAARPEQRLIDLSWLDGHFYVINLWTHAIMFFELVFALLIWVRLARPLLLGLSLIMWPLTAVVTDLWLFSALMLVANLAFASPSFVRAALSQCCQGPARSEALAEPATSAR